MRSIFVENWLQSDNNFHELLTKFQETGQLMRIRKWIGSAIAVIVVVLCGWTAANWKSLRPYEWQQVRSPDSQFRISFPGDPNESQISETATDGGKFVTYKLAVSPARGVLYTVNWWENPAQKGKSTNELFADFRDCNIKVFHGKIVSEKDIVFQGYPAKDTMLAANGQLVVNRVILVGPRVYSLWASDSPWHMGRGDVKKFIGSLSLHRD